MGLGGGVGSMLCRLRLPVILAIATALLVAAPARPVAALDAEEQAFLELINEYRVASGLNPLSLNSNLNEAARWMSQDMATNDYISHTDSLGREPSQRMASFGYSYNTWRAENLAAGIDAAHVAFELWKDSPGHNASMLNGNFKVIGIARSYGEGTVHGWYWATDFGGQGDPVPPANVVTVEPTPELTPEPTPHPSPEPTPQVAADQKPEPVQKPAPAPTPKPPSQREIALWVRQAIALSMPPWREHSTLLDSVLRAVSYMAERYLAVQIGAPTP